jgi:hypothetical protein
MNTGNLTKMLIAALLFTATALRAEEAPIQVAMEEGKAVAQFKVGDSRCVLKNDQIRCTPVTK